MDRYIATNQIVRDFVDRLEVSTRTTAEEISDDRNDHVITYLCDGSYDAFAFRREMLARNLHQRYVELAEQLIFIDPLRISAKVAS